MSRKSSKYQWRFFLGFLSFLALVIGVVFLWFYQNQKPVSDKVIATTFVIKKGEAVDSISQNLKSKNLIRSIPIFKFIVMKEGIATKIQAGSFNLSPHMTTLEIANSLTSGRQDIWVTILEGLRREEIADSIQAAFVEAGASFDKSTFLNISKDKEGMLFPDSYLFPLLTSEESIVSILTNTLSKKITPQMKQTYENQGKSLNEILTMASIIEREAQSGEARKLVSGILWKRIDNDWPLQVDATLQYIKGYDPIQKTWWKPPLAVDKELDSPYNTYQNLGLPPAPICSPSIDSIEAAIFPTPSENWFYITDNQGVMRYAKTVEQHNQNVQTYLR